MKTLTGHPFKDSSFRLTASLFLCAAVVAGDYLLRWDTRTAEETHLETLAHYEKLKAEFYQGKITYETAMNGYQAQMDTYNQSLDAWEKAKVGYGWLALILLLGYLILTGGDYPSLGLLVVPKQGWGYWCKAGLVLGILFGIILLPITFTWWWAGWHMAGIWDGVGVFEEALTEGGIRGPIYEELIYRVGVCVPVAARWGVRPAILVSGLLFSLAHFLGGNPNPANMIGGFFFAWCFLKSNSVLVPMLLHSAGNIIFLYFQWFYFGHSLEELALGG